MTPEIQLKIDEAINYLDSQEALEVLALAAKDASVQLQRLDYLRLNYIRMNAIDVDRVLALLKESLLAAYQIPDFDLDAKLADYLELLEYIDIQIDFLFKLKAIIVDHQEQLGTNNITVNGQAVPPTIANWIADYQSFNGTNAKDALGELRYINTGPNLKLINPQQRAILQNIIKIYDHVTTLTGLYEQIPDKLPPEQLEEFTTWANKKFEEEYGTEIPEQGLGASQVAVTPVITAPVQQLPSQPTAPVAPPSTPPTPVQPYKIQLQKDLDISAQPKTGLVFDTPTNVDLDQEVIDRKTRAAELVQQQKIQAKLLDLKKRKKS